MSEQEEYGKGVPTVISPSIATIESLIENIRYRGQLIARNQKLESAVGSTGFVGFVIGFLIMLVLILVPVIILR